MSDGITARSNWRQKNGLGILGKNIPNSINEVRHYNPSGPSQEEIQEILIKGKSISDILETADKWKDLSKITVINKILEMTNSIEIIRNASQKLFGEDPSILKIEKIGSKNFKKINDLLVEETIMIEEAALAELQAQIEAAQG